MTKKTYEKPTMQVVAIKQRTHILAGSLYGMNQTIQTEEVDEGW